MASRFHEKLLIHQITCIVLTHDRLFNYQAEGLCRKMWHLLGRIYFVLTHEDITTHWIMGLGHELAFVREFILIIWVIVHYVLNMVLNTVRLSDTICWHRSGSILAQVMACCLTAPSHYLANADFLSTVRPSGIHLMALTSGNGLVPSGIKPLPEPMLTQISVAIWRH